MGRTYETGSLTVDKEAGAVESPDSKITFSKKVLRPFPFQDDFILLFLDEESTQSDPDITISSSENLARITERGSLEWVVSAPPEMPDSARYATRHLLHDRRLVCRVAADDWQAYHEVDPATGDVVDRWPDRQFKFGGTQFEFDAEIYQIEDAFGETYIETKSGMYAFGADGSCRWSLRLETPYNYTGSFAHRGLEIGERQLKMMNTGPGRAPRVPTFYLNRQTGRIVRGREMKPDWTQDYLAEADLVFWFPTYLKSDLAVFTDDCDIAWDREFDQGITAAATVGRRTVVQTGHGTSRQLFGFDERGTQLWERSVEGSVTLHVDGETLEMIFEDDEGTENVVKLAPKTGQVIACDSGTREALDSIDW